MIVHCVALRTVKYSDRQSIVSAWSAEMGRIGLLVPAGSSKEARRLRALMQPLQLFEGVVEPRHGRDLLNIREVRPWGAVTDLASDPAKSVVAMFLAEVLDKVLRESPPDPLLADYIFTRVHELDQGRTTFTANFPILFLFGLGTMLGVAPDFGSWRPGAYFDMDDARFRTSLPSSAHILAPGEARLVEMFSRLTTPTAARLHMPRRVRKAAIDYIMQYYSIHHTPMAASSLSILSDILG